MASPKGPKNTPTRASATRGGAKLGKPKVSVPKASPPSRPKTGSPTLPSTQSMMGKGVHAMPKPQNLGKPTLNGGGPSKSKGKGW